MHSWPKAQGPSQGVQPQVFLRNVQDLKSWSFAAAHRRSSQIITAQMPCPSGDATHVADTRQLAYKLHPLRATRNPEIWVHRLRQGPGICLQGLSHIAVDEWEGSPCPIFEAPFEPKPSERPVERLGPTSTSARPARSPPDIPGGRSVHEQIRKPEASGGYSLVG